MLTDYYLNVQRGLFHLMGFDILAAEQIWTRPYILLSSTFLIIWKVPTIAAFVILNISSLNALANGMLFLLTSLLTFVKFSMMIYYRNPMGEFISRLHDMLAIEYNKSAHYKHIIAKENRREQLMSRIYRNCFVSALILCLSLPLLPMGYNYWQAGKFVPQAPIPSSYPWNLHNMHNYLLTYLWDLTLCFATCMFNVAMDSLFFSFIHNMCALFKIAQHKIQHFQSGTEYETQLKLFEAIELYQDCLHMCQMIDDFFKLIICAQFFTSSLQICMTGYQISSTSLNPDIALSFALSVTFLVQMFIFCYCGEYLYSESINFAKAIYEMDWCEYTGQGMTRSIVICLIRAQRGHRIKAYFFEPTMMAFTTILQAAMSYITLLRSGG